MPDQTQSVAVWMDDGWMHACIDCLLAVLVTTMMLMIAMLPPEQPLPTSSKDLGGRLSDASIEGKNVESSDPSQKISQPFVQRPKGRCEVPSTMQRPLSDIGCGG